MTDETCPVCNEGVIVEHKESKKFDDGVKVDIVSSICDTCGADVTNTTQTVQNKRAYMMAKHGGYDFL